MFLRFKEYLFQGHNVAFSDRYNPLIYKMWDFNYISKVTYKTHTVWF